jgi:2-polyprenyl-3-methyl-5-hydroxy-6-metoxy-1,4-benzoquinol methylase
METLAFSSLIKNGESAFAAGDLESARNFFEKAVMIDPAHFESLNDLGVIAFHQGNNAAAASYFEKALQLNGTYRLAIENLSKCFLLQGQYSKTIEMLQKALAFNLFSTEMAATMTQCFILLNDLDAARTMLALLRRLNGFPEREDYLSDWILLHNQKKQGDYAKRSWCREHASLIRHLENVPGLNMIRGRFWEYPFVFEKVMERPNSRIIDIGMGDGVFAKMLSEKGHQVTGVDSHESCRSSSQDKISRDGLECFQADARCLEAFHDNQFDTALLVSVIEHIPSNTIWCEKRQTLKTGAILRAEIPEKVKALKEALRVVIPGGRVIITSDIYLDYPSEMNISWKELIGLTGIDRADFSRTDDLYITDNPIHKGRGLAIAIIIEKNNDGQRN